MDLPTGEPTRIGAFWHFPDGTRLPVVAGGDGEQDEQLQELDGLGGLSADEIKALHEAQDDGGGSGDGDEPKLTQAEVDAIVEKRLARERKAWEKRQADEKAKAEMDDAERAKAEKAEAEKAVEEARQEVLTTKVETAAERYAIAAGVKADRVTKFLRLVDLDLDDLTDDGKVDGDAVKKLIDAEVAANPEFKGTTSKGGASGGDDFGGDGKKIWTRAEVAKLSQDEFEKHEKEILEQLGAGSIK